MKKNNLNKSIAIIGGMGPQASAKLLEVIIAMCSEIYGVREETNYPEVILNSLPVPDFISNKKNVNTTLKIVQNSINNLEIFNPICFGLACNTGHLLLNDLQNKTKVPFVSIIEEVADVVSRSRIKKVGLLATPVTINTSLYENVLRQKNIEVITPSLIEQKFIEKIVRNIISGRPNTIDKGKMVIIAENLLLKGSQGIILGCTELPLIFPKNFPAPVFDSIEILARALLKRYYLNGDQI